MANDLYPPVIASALPAFKYSNSIYEIPFSISNYNEPSQVSKWIQVSIVNPYTGESALDETRYPNGIIMLVTNNSSNIYNYLDNADNSINLPIDCIANPILGNFYKIQLRFCTADIPEPPHAVDDNGIAKREEWYAANLDYFSEWSKACLFRIIGNPVLKIETTKNFYENYQFISFDDVNDSDIDQGGGKQWSLLKNQTQSSSVARPGYIRFFNGVYEYSMLVFSGTMQMDNNLRGEDGTGPEVAEYKQNLKNYRLTLYENGKILQDSQNLTASNNEFYYPFKYELKNGVQYVVILNYTTLNNYSTEQKFVFNVELSTADDFISAVDVDQNAANGSCKITVDLDYTSDSAKEDESYNKTKFLLIRRSNNFNGYDKWQDVHLVAIPLVGIDKIRYTWQDTTVDSGVWYQYKIRQVFELDNLNRPMRYGEQVWLTDKIMMDMDDIFISAKDDVLKIKYNPSISNFKYVVQQSITNTIGGTFPYIRRNGKTKYRQFNLSALIASTMDEDEVFISKTQKYEEFYSYYDCWRKQNRITTQRQNAALCCGQIESYSSSFTDDRIWQRHFREKVIDFLCDGKPKLFRSPTQGNILVFINEVSFTPNKTLGRHIYDVSMKCTEIADATIDNLDKYGIINKDLLEVKYFYMIDNSVYDPKTMGAIIEESLIPYNYGGEYESEIYSIAFNDRIKMNAEEHIDGMYNPKSLKWNQTSLGVNAKNRSRNYAGVCLLTRQALGLYDELPYFQETSIYKSSLGGCRQ